MIKYGFFDAVMVDGVPDRTVDADFFKHLNKFLSVNKVKGGEVAALSSMRVSVAPFDGVVNGHFAYDDASTTLQLASGTSQRVYSICLRLKPTARTLELVAVNGSPLDTSESQDYCFATVTVPANATSVTSSMIKDIRTDDGSNRNIYVQSSQPSNPSVGDLWFW